MQNLVETTAHAAATNTSHALLAAAMGVVDSKMSQVSHEHTVLNVNLKSTFVRVAFLASCTHEECAAWSKSVSVQGLISLPKSDHV